MVGRWLAWRSLSPIARNLRQRRWNNDNPWVRHGGACSKVAKVELKLGLCEADPTFNLWEDASARQRAVEAGRHIERYMHGLMATPERYRLWETFREVLEDSLRQTVGMKQKAHLLMMGGVAQGMATMDGDLDMIIFIPDMVQKFSSVMRGRVETKNVLHSFARRLRQRGLEVVVILARVPIIQYRPRPEIEALFSLPGSDSLVRYLVPTIPNADIARLQTRLPEQRYGKVEVLQVPNLPPVFAFSSAADAYRAMLDNVNNFRMPQLRKAPNQMFPWLEGKSQPSQDGGDVWKELRKRHPDLAPFPSGLPEAKKDSIDLIVRQAVNRDRFSEPLPVPFSIDISVSVTNEPWGPRNSELLRRYLSVDPALRALAMFVKWWSKRSVPYPINSSRTGWLTSYAVLIMLLHYLIQTKRVTWIDPMSITPILTPDSRLPSVRPLRDAECMQVVSDFIGFCEYYAVGFDYENYVATVSSSHAKKRSECSPEVLSAKNVAFILEDPYENRSLGHPIRDSMLLQIRLSCLAGARAMYRFVSDPKRVERTYREEIIQHGRSILEEVFDVTPGRDGCSVCGEKSDLSLCKKCEGHLQQSRIPSEFFMERLGLEATPVEKGSSIERQKRKERALREHDFLTKNHKGQR